MKYFWWIVSAVVLICVALVMKLSLKPRVVSLISPSTLSTETAVGDSGGGQLARILSNQLRAYFDQRRIVVLGLPWFNVGVGSTAHIDARLIESAVSTLAQKNKFDAIWVLNSQVAKMNLTKSRWGPKTRSAANWKTAGEEFDSLLKSTARVLIVTDAVDNYNFSDPQSLISYLAVHFKYDDYMSITILPVMAKAAEQLPAEMVCPEGHEEGVAAPAESTHEQYCKTELPAAVDFESRELMKSRNIDRERPVITAEQRSSSIFAVFIHSP